MKKRMTAALLLSIMLLAGCSSEEPEATPAPTASVVSSGQYFKVTSERSGGVTHYTYSVTDRDGNELESAVCANQPRVAVINDDLIGIRFYVDDRTFCRYYDVKNGRVSDSFFNPFWDDGTLVAYNDYAGGQRIVVRDIFDPEGYCAEQTLDLPTLTITVTACEQDEDTGVLTIEYVYGDRNTEGSLKLPTRAEE